MAARIVLVVFCFVSLALAGGKKAKKLEESVSFDVRPSGQTAHETIKLENGVTCVFTCAAVGGTKEEWAITLRRTKKNTYSCTIERPEQSSYLYFMSFAASILDHDIETAEVFDNNGALLQDEEYVIADSGQSVKHKEMGFESNLSKIIITARKHKPEV